MSGLDGNSVFMGEAPDMMDDGDPNSLLRAVQRFKEFLCTFHEGNFVYKYRDELRRRYILGQYYLDVDMSHLFQYDEGLSEKLTKFPADYLPKFEEAAKDVADEITRPRPAGEEQMEEIQIMLYSSAKPIKLRDVKSSYITQFVKVHGIIISASGIRVRPTSVTLECTGCGYQKKDLKLKPGFEGIAMPRSCDNPNIRMGQKCPMDPFVILPESCLSLDFQTLKLQEAPDDVPVGELPRHIQLYCDRNLIDQAVPGNRVTVHGVYSVRSVGSKQKDKSGAGIRIPYLRVIAMEVDREGSGRAGTLVGHMFTEEEEESFRRLSADPNVYEKIAKSIAPSIFGYSDIKKAIACLLFGGSRKRLPDGLARRGDINILLLGDPGTAKSQLLKFVERVAPIGVYTSGKGSSAAGLTAAVVQDPVSRNFAIEGGAMVLADGGVVCIDEFDKMREDDRVAIHEAMEQQTISIAKAGITTTLNSRCSVLAAANSVFGRWDDTRGDMNMEFMPTILSRFDMIFIVKDIHDMARDRILAKHVIGVHMNAELISEEQEGELTLNFLRKYILYCRDKCGPRLSDAAAEKLKHRYVLMRSGIREQEGDKPPAIPITIRQLEAVVRISEALAKMQLIPFAGIQHVDEALRLFQVSTLDAAASGSLSGADEFTTHDEQQLLSRIEAQIKRRFAIGSQVSVHNIMQEFSRQKYPDNAISKVISALVRRGEVQHRMQRKMLYRVK
ncbi:DNA replication licensing factor mcm5-like [Paramacrobiotus metropolitanus]|uniref:DNA replication licensing factor mcm5-like n=1 Tax=Paramacrobiotus metropolitanus TaxID=2943436 RepID=UPI002445E429|nr:DNA replication licensing factor mcm5-like [Paramacrobiotus metropolitanus]